MAVDQEIIERVLDAIPQTTPFRFIDEIIELDENRIVSAYRFKEDEYFYEGHFPGKPITPGVILVETMAQAGVVALGIYQLLKNGLKEEEIRQITTLFALIDSVEFSGIVNPGERVIVSGEKIYFRKGNLKSKVSIEKEDGTSVCHGILTGAGVNYNA